MASPLELFGSVPSSFSSFFFFGGGLVGGRVGINPLSSLVKLCLVLDFCLLVFDYCLSPLPSNQAIPIFCFFMILSWKAVCQNISFS